MWTAVGLLLVGMLLWLIFRGGRSSVSGEPIVNGDAAVGVEPAAVVEPAVNREPAPVLVSESTVGRDPAQEPPGGAPATASLDDAIELTPEIVQAPPDVVVDAPFGGELPVSGGEDAASDPAYGSDPASVEQSTQLAAAGLRAEFETALEIFRQESLGYEERRAAYERGFVGCNALNSWYRSVGDAFVRLSSKVTEAGPATASAWSAEYEGARAIMDEIDRHYLPTECPLPR